MRSYLRDAPSEAIERYRGKYWDKVHIGWKGGDGGSYSLTTFAMEGKTALGASDPEYQPRPSAFECSALGSITGDQQRNTGRVSCRPYDTLTQYRYPDGELRWDKRAAYHNPKYPWIQAVYAFQHKRHHAKQFDIARLEFPRSVSTTGLHVVHWMWRGYCTCTPHKAIQCSAADAAPRMQRRGCSAADACALALAP